ncbi:hypothetical protein NDU88_007765, partial [Pleurodeles waltl]
AQTISGRVPQLCSSHIGRNKNTKDNCKVRCSTRRIQQTSDWSDIAPDPVL